MTTSPYLSLSDIAELVRFKNAESARSWVRRKGIPQLKGRKVYRRSDVERALEGKRCVS